SKSNSRAVHPFAQTRWLRQTTGFGGELEQIDVLGVFCDVPLQGSLTYEEHRPAFAKDSRASPVPLRNKPRRSSIRRPGGSEASRALASAMTRSGPFCRLEVEPLCRVPQDRAFDVGRQSLGDLERAVFQVGLGDSNRFADHDL